MPHSTYLPGRMGRAAITPTGSFEAGSFQSFTLVYTAGYFGIDDTGSIKIVHRFASDMGRPQWSDPTAPNYTTVEASNGAVLDVLYDPKLNIRPWDKTLLIRVVRGFLRENRVGYPIFLGGVGSIERLYATDELSVPMSILIDDKGVVRELFPGWSERTHKRFAALSGGRE